MKLKFIKNDDFGNYFYLICRKDGSVVEHSYDIWNKTSGIECNEINDMLKFSDYLEDNYDCDIGSRGITFNEPAPFEFVYE